MFISRWTSAQFFFRNTLLGQDYPKIPISRRTSAQFFFLNTFNFEQDYHLIMPNFFKIFISGWTSAQFFFRNTLLGQDYPKIPISRGTSAQFFFRNGLCLCLSNVVPIFFHRILGGHLPILKTLLSEQDNFQNVCRQTSTHFYWKYNMQRHKYMQHNRVTNSNHIFNS